MNKELAPPSEVNALAKKLSFQLLRQEKENHPPQPPKKPLLPKKTLSEAQKLKMRQGKEAKKLLKNNLLQRANEMSPETKLAQVKARIVHESKLNENSPVAPLIGPLNIAKRPEYRPPKMTKKQAKKAEMNNSPASQLSLPQALERARLEAIRALALSDVDPLDKIARMTQIMEYDDPSKFYSMVQVQPRSTPLATSNPQKISSALSKVASVIGAEADPNDKTAVIKEIMKDIDKAKERALNPLPINSQLPAPPEKKDFVMDHTAGNAKSYHLYHRKILGYFIYPDMTPPIGYKRSVADLINEIDSRIAASPSFGYSSSVAPASIAWPPSIAPPGSISGTPEMEHFMGLKMYKQKNPRYPFRTNSFIYTVDEIPDNPFYSQADAKQAIRDYLKKSGLPKKEKFESVPPPPNDNYYYDGTIRGHPYYVSKVDGSFIAPSLPEFLPVKTRKEAEGQIWRILNARPSKDPKDESAEDGDPTFKQSHKKKDSKKKEKKEPEYHIDDFASLEEAQATHSHSLPPAPPLALPSPLKLDPEKLDPEDESYRSLFAPRLHRPRPSPSSPKEDRSTSDFPKRNEFVTETNLADIFNYWLAVRSVPTEKKATHRGFDIYKTKGKNGPYYVPGLGGLDLHFQSLPEAKQFIDGNHRIIIPKERPLSPEMAEAPTFEPEPEEYLSPPRQSSPGQAEEDLTHHQIFNLLPMQKRLDQYAKDLDVPVNDLTYIKSYDSILYPELGYYDLVKGTHSERDIYFVPEINSIPMATKENALIAIATEFNRQHFMANPKDKRQHQSTLPGEIISLREVAGGRSNTKHKKLAHIRKQLSHGGATTAFLEPYFEDGVLKHLNYSGPGNPMTPEYIQAHPPITRVNGQPSWEDSIAFQHDLDYGTAFKERDQEKRKRLVREADLKFIREYEKHRDDPLRLGYDTIKAKISVEDALSKSKPIDALLSHITPYYGRQ